MRVYRIEYHEYEYRCDMSHNDWALTPVRGKHVMADDSLKAVDMLRADLSNRRIEIACIEYVCKVDIKK
jgi:hypothetical protein